MATLAQITATRVIFNGGQFDSDFRYIRETSGAHLTTLLAGPSLAVSTNSTQRISWRFQCGGYTLTGQATGGGGTNPSAPGSVSNTPTNVAL